MKVIDLLNKIANGEEVPKKIEYKGVLREYNEQDKDYTTTELYEPMYLFYGVLKSGSSRMFVEALNDEVEIIEEKQGIKQIPIPEIESVGNRRILNVELKINELINAVNEIRRG